MGGHVAAGRLQVGTVDLSPPTRSAGGDRAARVARVAVDVPALADQRRELDYLVPPPLADTITVGSVVRVTLQGRRVGGWVVALDVEPPADVTVVPISAWSGQGPPPDLVDLARWAAWRWAGRLTAMLRAATPQHPVRTLPPRPAAQWTPVARVGTSSAARLAREALAAGEAIVRLPPAAEPTDLLRELTAAGPALVIAPTTAAGRHLGLGSVPLAVVPEGWARAAAGGTIVAGARAAAWAPAPDARVVVVLDAHDNSLVEERVPSWSAWVVAAERARRLGIPCVLVTPCPTLEQLRWGTLVLPDRAEERQGWAAIEVDDRRGDDPRTGLLGERLVPMLRAATTERPVLCVLNRKGRVRLLRCRTCGHLSACEHCGGPVASASDAAGIEQLVCSRCGRPRPFVCQECGSAALRVLRTGVSRVREELEAIARLPVAEVTVSTVGSLPATPVLVGTEALLRRFGRGRAGAVVFLDFDSELMAPRFGAREDALVLLARAARAVGGRGEGRVVVQTRQPGHVVIEAAVRADPGRLVDVELPQREELGLPPFAALAVLSGDAGVVGPVAAAVSDRGVEVLGPTDGRWVARAADHQQLCDALAAVGRPVGAGNALLRIEVDPLRL